MAKRMQITVDYSRNRLTDKITARACLGRPIRTNQKEEFFGVPQKSNIRCGVGFGYDANMALRDALSTLASHLRYRVSNVYRPPED